jgi:hypothetical protein
MQNSCQITALSATRLAATLLHCASAEAVQYVIFWCRNLTSACRIMLDQAMAVMLPTFDTAIDKQSSAHDKNHIIHLLLL